MRNAFIVTMITLFLFLSGIIFIIKITPDKNNIHDIDKTPISSSSEVNYFLIEYGKNIIKNNSNYLNNSLTKTKGDSIFSSNIIKDIDNICKNNKFKLNYVSNIVYLSYEKSYGVDKQGVGHYVKLLIIGTLDKSVDVNILKEDSIYTISGKFNNIYDYDTTTPNIRLYNNTYYYNFGTLYFDNIILK